MRIISFCAEGIKQAAKAGFLDWVLKQDADVIAIQDLRAWEYDLNNDFFPIEYNAYFFDAVDSRDNGVAIYTRKLPKAIMTGMAMGDLDLEGRYIQADFDNLSVGSLLAPFASDDDDAGISKKNQFYRYFIPHLEKISNKRRNFIFCGNFNVAHSDIDVQHPSQHEDVTPGFLSHERDWFDEILGGGDYIDAFRELNIEPDAFTFWPDDETRDRNGWRVDTQIVSGDLRENITAVKVYTEQVFSRHAPVIIDYDIEL
jgi:exodeoxyribonuclease-3